MLKMHVSQMQNWDTSYIILENFIVQVHVANNETYIIYNLTFAIFNFTDNTLYIILINFESSNIPSYAQKY